MRNIKKYFVEHCESHKTLLCLNNVMNVGMMGLTLKIVFYVIDFLTRVSS